MRLQIHLATQIRNWKTAKEIADESDGDYQRYQPAAIVLNQREQLAPRGLVQVWAQVAYDVLQDVGLAPRGRQPLLP